MLSALTQSIADTLKSIILEKYRIAYDSLAFTTPPRIEMGELALPIAFDLARKVRRAPRGHCPGTRPGGSGDPRNMEGGRRRRRISQFPSGPRPDGSSPPAKHRGRASRLGAGHRLPWARSWWNIRISTRTRPPTSAICAMRRSEIPSFAASGSWETTLRCRTISTTRECRLPMWSSASNGWRERLSRKSPPWRGSSTITAGMSMRE